MRLGGRLQAAMEVLNDIETRKRPAAEALKDWGVSHRFAGAGDRAVIGNLVYDALRRKLSIAWRMDSDAASALAFGALFIDGGMDAASVEAALAGDKFAPPALDATQALAWSSRDLEQAPDHVRADVPEWCVAALQGVFGDAWIAQAAALAARPPVDLRVNRLKTSPDKLLAALAAAGAAPAPLLEDALRIPPIEALGRHPNVQTDQSFLDGWFEVQDLGSQIAARFANAQPGEQVLDYCAGAGGKTLALASSMNNRGQVHAFDAERARLSPIHDRLQRAGVRNTQVYGDIKALAPLVGQMDLVLTDAPCTGSGTWRRRPDAKWRLTELQLEQREADQIAILDAARHYVKPGGRLVYVTCSLFDRENNFQVEKFLAANPDFSETAPRDCWQKAVPNNSGVEPVYLSHGCAFSPAQTDTDGFYVGVLTRHAG